MKATKMMALVCSAAMALGAFSGAVKAEAADASSLMAAEFLTGEYEALPADGPSYNFIVGYAGGENTITHTMMLAWQEALNFYSDGKITLTLFPNAQLGSDAEMISSCIAGDIDIVSQCGSTHATFVPETQIFDTPFLFSGVELDKVEEVLLHSDFRTIYDEANEKAGLKLLMLKAAETMDLTSNKAVYSLDDLKGLKIRTAQSESRMKIWSELGANPTPLAYSELYMALQNGTVEASDNIYSNDVSAGLGEQQKYIIPTDHFLVSFDTTMNLNKFNSMPEEYQKFMLQMGEDITRYDYSLSEADIEKNFQALINDYNMEVCEISDDFRAALTEKAQSAIDAARVLTANDELYAALDAALGR